jgi:hypothetical protein
MVEEAVDFISELFRVSRELPNENPTNPSKAKLSFLP